MNDYLFSLEFLAAFLAAFFIGEWHVALITEIKAMSMVSFFFFFFSNNFPGVLSKAKQIHYWRSLKEKDCFSTC